MKKILFSLLFIFLTGSLIAQENFYYDLRGMEDDTGNSHLFYRYLNYNGSGCTNYNDFSFYHFDTSSLSDSLKIENYLRQNSQCKSEGIRTNDIIFYDAHPDSFVTHSSILDNGFFFKITDFKKINLDITGENRGYEILYDSSSKIFLISLLYDQITYLLPFNDSQLFEQKLSFDELNQIPMPVSGIEPRKGNYIGYDDNYLFYSKERGLNSNYYFSSSIEASSYEFTFTEDSTIIYLHRRSHDSSSDVLKKLKYTGSNFEVSTILENKNFIFQINKTSPNEIYISDTKLLKKSTDSGLTFETIQVFDQEITGLYKKPNHKLLYVLTRQNLFRIENNQKTLLMLNPVSNEETQEIPSSVSLKQNYPNPFNPTTTIQFELDKSTFAKLTVYDVLGRKIRELVNEVRPAGTNTIQFDATNLASGIYLYRLEANGIVQTKRLTLIK